MILRKRKFGDLISKGVESVGNFANKKIHKMSDNLESKVILLQDRFLIKLTMLLMFVIGFLFIFFGLFYLLVEKYYFSNTVAYFSVGILILLISILFRLKEKKIMSRR